MKNLFTFDNFMYVYSIAFIILNTWNYKRLKNVGVNKKQRILLSIGLFLCWMISVVALFYFHEKYGWWP